MFVPDRLKTNAFRVLRLSTDATLSEIHKGASSMRREVSLGVANAAEGDVPLLGEISRTEADIRAAIGRLENLTQRLSDRLMWFHQPPESQSAPKGPAGPSELDGADWNHDEALRDLFAAYEAGFDDVGVPVWVRALRAWHQVVSDDNYWAHIVELEQRGAFEPAAFPSEIDALRDEAVALAAEPLVVAGRDSLARGDTAAVRRILAALEELTDTGTWVAIAQHDIASPAVERFRALCRAVREEFGSKILREQNASERNKSVCDAGLKRFRAEIEPRLHRIIQLVPPDHQAAQESREEAALCLTGIATDYTWADDFIASEKLHEEALRLAQNTLGTIRIEHGLEQIRAAARKQRVFGAAISSAPALGTVNGFGCTLYGSSDYDQETQSYATTQYFVALFVPIFPIGRYRVINAGGRTYRFLGKLPLRKADRWHLGIAATAIAAMILIGVFSSQNSNVSSATSTSSYTTSSQNSRASIAGSAELTGTYSGVVQNLTAGVSADFKILVTEKNRAIQGCMEVKPPLIGSGSLRGTTNGLNFSFVVVSESMQIEFDGQRNATNLSGTYLVSILDGGSKQKGTFVLNRISPEGLSSGFKISNCSSDDPRPSAPAEMSALKARIDSGRSQMALLKTQLQSVIEEITSLNAQMEILNAELKSLDEQQKAGVQIDIDDYNAKVKTHNALLGKQRALIAANRTDFNAYDALVDQDSVLVKQYNTLLKYAIR